MSFAATDASDSSRLRRGMSLGPIKMQFLNYTCVSTDTSGTITADALFEVTGVIVDGLVQTTAATFSGNVITLAFVAPGGTTVAGDIIAFGV